MGMQDARPNDFGAYPITEASTRALGVAIARLATFYAIPIDAEHVMTHAEAAIIDGYFGLDEIEERWDLARLRPSPSPLCEQDAREAGAQLRSYAAHGTHAP
jgi:hypothetical protein